LPTWSEVLSFAKQAKELIQNSSMLNPLARGAIKSIPIAGEILLEIWDNSADTAEDKSEQILETLTTIERMNENTFQTFCQKMDENRIEILRNRDKLNQILFETSLILDKIEKMDEKVDVVGSDVLKNQNKLDDVLKNQEIILNSLHIEKKISVENIVTKEYDEKIEKLRIEKERLSWELEKSNRKPSINTTLTLREANFFYYAKKIDQAIKLYDIILKENSNNVYALNNKGLALSRLDKHEEAMTWYDKALEIDTINVSILNNKGLAFYNLGKYQEAMTWYDKALEIDTNNVNALYNKSCCCSLTGDNDEAIFLLQKTISLDQSYKKMARKDKDFSALSGDNRFKKTCL